MANDLIAYFLTALSCLLGAVILVKALPRTGRYRQPWRYVGGVFTVAGSFIGWPLLCTIAFLPDKVNGPFLSFLALFGFIFTLAHGGNSIAKANNSVRDDVLDDIGRLFS